MSDLGTGMVSHTSIHKRKSTTLALRIICLCSSWTWSLCAKSSGFDESVHLVLLLKEKVTPKIVDFWSTLIKTLH